MFKFFRKHRSVVLVFMAACVGGLILFGIGGTSMMSSPHDTIVKINGQKISQMDFDRLYNQMVRHRNENSPKEKQQMMGQVLNELIREEVFVQEAKKYGIEITDQELQLQLAAIPAFQKDGQFDSRTYVQVVSQSFGITPHEFEDKHKRDLAGRKLNQLIASSIHVSDDELAAALQSAIQAEKDPKKKKELHNKPEDLRKALQDREINMAFNDWLNQLNSSLKVNMVSDRFQKMLSAPAQ